MHDTQLRLRRTLGSLPFAAALSAGLALGACSGDDELGDGDDLGDGDGGEGLDAGDGGDGDRDDGDGGDGLEVPAEIADACMGYCEKLADCNEETTVGECMEKCKGVLYACEQHEKDEALDQVIQCGEEDCLALPLCTVSAGIQCLTGLGL